MLEQDYNKIEIICVNDGSADNTLEILNEYFPYVRILSHPGNINLGQAASLNLGISSTEADLIAFLDADDIWYPDKIKKQVEVFENHPAIGLVYTNGFAIDEIGEKLYQLISNGFREENIPGRILLDNYIRSPSSTMVRKNVFEKTGLFKVGLQSMDHDMWIKIGEKSKFYYLAECLMGYRIHIGQQSLKRRQWEDGFNILREASERYPYQFSVKRKRLAVLYYRLAENDWREGRYLRSLWNYMMAGIHDPKRAIRTFN